MYVCIPLTVVPQFTARVNVMLHKELQDINPVTVSEKLPLTLKISLESLQSV